MNILRGITKNKICLNVLEKAPTNSLFFFCVARALKVGKTAIENETPKSPKGALWILFAKLKTAKLPAAKVEAKIVMIVKFI